VSVMASASSPPPLSSSMAAPAKMTVLGEAVRLVACGTATAFELSAQGFTREEIQVQIISEYISIQIYSKPRSLFDFSEKSHLLDDEFLFEGQQLISRSVRVVCFVFWSESVYIDTQRLTVNLESCDCVHYFFAPVFCKSVASTLTYC
jgi:hypothetical protein